jgi:Protein of unknown function (DUF1217)
MTTTTAAYLNVIQNLPRMQTMTADQPAVKTATTYYEANIGSVTSVSGLVNNYRLLSYALSAFGLGNEVNSKALVTQVLEGGVSNPKSLANTLSNQQWKAFAEAFDFTDAGATPPSNAQSVKTVTGDYVEQQLESNEGAQDPGVQLALYFQRVAPTVTSAFGILADPNLLQVVNTIFGLAPESASTNLDSEAAAISKLMPISDLQDPTKVQQLTERFTAMYDLDYGPESNSTSSLSVTNGNSSSSPASGASSILGGIINSNGTSIADALNSDEPTSTFSNSLLTSLQSFKLGG